MNSKPGNKKFDITGIGNSCMDIVGDCNMAFMARHAVHKSHCIYVDFPALQKIKSELGAYDLIAGGAAANTIYAFQSLGGKTAFLGKIAEDVEGRTFEKSMQSIGVSTSLNVSPETDIGSTQVISLRTPDGDRSFVTYQGVAETIGPNDLDYSVIAQSKIVYFDGYTMYSPHALEAFLKSAKTAQDAGGVAVFNPGDLSIVELHKAAVQELLGKIDILICNLAEARSMYGTDTLEDAALKLPGILKTGAVTDGANGALVFHDGEVILMPPPAPREGELYTLGAGDHFSAGFLYGYVQGFPLARMAKLAELCALDCLSHAGARPLAPLTPLIAISAL